MFNIWYSKQCLSSCVNQGLKCPWPAKRSFHVRLCHTSCHISNVYMTSNCNDVVLSVLGNRSFFMSMGGLVGFGYLPLRNCMTPPLACNFFPHGPPPSRNNFFLMTPPPPLPPNQKQIILLTLTKRLCTVYIKDKRNCYCDFFTVLLKSYRSLLR